MYTLGDVSPASAGGGLFDSITGSLTTLAPVLTQAYRDRLVLKAQIARAEAGLPALNLNQASPPVRVQTTIGPTGDAKQLMLLAGAGALALGGVWLFTRRRGRGR